MVFNALFNAALIVACSSFAIPWFVAWGVIARSNGHADAKAGPLQRRLDGSLVLLAVLTPMIWWECTLLGRYPTVSLFEWHVIGLPGLCFLAEAISMVLALLGRGKARVALLSAHAFLLALAVTAMAVAVIGDVKSGRSTFS